MQNEYEQKIYEGGYIWDEHDEVVKNYSQIDKNIFSFDGTTQMSQVMELFDFETQTDANSVGGWVTELLGRIGEKGDIVEFENLIITIQEADTHRILKVSIKQCVSSVDTN